MAPVLNVTTAGISVKDVAAVSLKGFAINVDEAILKNLGAGSSKGPKGESQPAVLPPGSDERFSEDEILPKEVVRASMFCLIVKLLQGRSGVQAPAITLLADLLNNDLTPDIPETVDDDCGAMGYLVRALALGEGGCWHKLERHSLSSCLTVFDLQPVSFTQFEVDGLLAGNAFSVGAAALSVIGAKTLGGIGDVVSGLSCEGLQAFTESYAAEHHDIARAHRGAITVANNLRFLLDGSKFVNGRKGAEVDPDSVRCIPQYHGTVRDAYTHAKAMIAVEISSAELKPQGKAGLFHPQPVYSAMSDVVTSVSAMASGSARRIRHLVSPLEGSKLPAGLCPTEGDSPWNGPADLAENSVRSLQEKVSRLGKMNCVPGDSLRDISTAGLLASLTAYNLIREAQKILSIEFVAGLQAAALLEAQSTKDKKAKAPPADKLADKAAAGDALASAVQEKLSVKENDKQKAKKEKKVKEKVFLGTGNRKVRAHFAPDFELVSDVSGLKSALDLIQSSFDPFDAPLDEFLGGLFGSTNIRRKPKIAKGTKDYGAEQMMIREKAFSVITSVFKRHGATALDTPVFELRDTLTSKYGEDSKLIYDLADQGGELLSLRYDLTVPFARYVAMNNIAQIKRYHIARVYRRDNPAMNKGRFREFYQCDIDIAGDYPDGQMLPDAEILKCVTEILDELEIGSYMIKLNHRMLLDAIFNICGVPEAKFHPICSAIDKLDKEPWEAVRTEMVDVKGLDAASADKIWEFVQLKGEPRALYKTITEKALFGKNDKAAVAMDHMSKLFEYLDAFGCLDKVSFDLSLARGLDYYTGLIYETVLTGTDRVGSIAAGGRYDELVGSFSVSGKRVPCVGVSIGIERIFTIMEELEKNKGQLRKNDTQVYIATLDKGINIPRLKLINKCWAAGIKAEFMYKDEPKIQKQLPYALDNQIPYMMILGGIEVEKNVVKVKKLASKEEFEMTQDEAVAYLLKELATA